MKTPVIRIDSKDGIPVSVLRDTDKNNTLVAWSVSWDGSKPGKRGVSSWSTSWPYVQKLLAQHAGKNPVVSQSAIAGFAF